MTDMPERIWASEYFADVIPCAGDWTGEQPETPDGSSEYIRADVAEARVAAALERAATCTEWTAWGERHNLTEASRRAIRALIPQSAQDALDQLIAAQALETAASEAHRRHVAYMNGTSSVKMNCRRK